MFSIKCILIFSLYLILTFFGCKNTNKNTLEYEMKYCPDEISKINKNKIETGELKPLYLLEEIDKEKFDIIIKYFPKINIHDYYYSTDRRNGLISNILYEISICIQPSNDILENNEILIQPKDKEIRYVEYAMWHYDALTNKYCFTIGGLPECFSLLFSYEYGFLGLIGWE